MKKIKSLGLSLVTVILLAVILPLFAPAFANKVNAAEKVIEVGSYDSLVSALKSSSNRGKNIKLTSSIVADKEITIIFQGVLKWQI